MLVHWMRRLTVVFTAIMLTGCATVMNHGSQKVNISSLPIGAGVTIDSKPYGKTPVVAKLARGEHHQVVIELPGYKTYNLALTRKVSGWVWGNAIIGGVIGVVIDVATGNMYKLTPEQVMAELKTESAEQQQANLSDPNAVYVSIVLTPKPAWEKIGQLARDTTALKP